jgi:hypothetical protein
MDWSNVLWRESHRIGLVPSVFCALAWVACGGLIAWVGSNAPWPYEWLAWVFLIALSLVVAFGALVSFWIIGSHFDFRRRGYQVRWLTRDDWVYEERRADGSTEYFPFMRKIVGDGYPAPCEVYIPDENTWKLQAPEWARERRTEILARIADLFGADRGGRIQMICDSVPPS